LDALDPGQALERRRQLVAGEVPAGGAQLVQDELQPQLAGLVLDDEQQLVVVLGAAAGVLRGQQVVEVEVRGVGHGAAEVGADRRLQRPHRSRRVGVRRHHGRHRSAQRPR
jgi:hypothetical protein